MDYLACFMREEDKRVYAVKNSECLFHDAIAGGVRGIRTENYEAIGEMLFADSNTRGFGAWEAANIESEDKVNIGGKLRNRYTLFVEDGTPFVMVEGVGFDGVTGGRFPFVNRGYIHCGYCPRTLGLSHMLDEKGELVYKGAYYGRGYLSGITDVKADRPVSVQVNRRDVRVTVPAHEQGAVSLMDLNGKVLRTIAVAEG
ncbi:MAG: hypothetical protein IJ808_00595, partial [Muribaculaceae bacterium]|nr:hypothetical protein [Muribaculaceae bacterium]